MAKYCMKCMEPIGDEKQCPHCGYQGTEAAAPHRLQPGTVLQGRYLIGKALGQGGFGITYMGRDQKLDMRVAVKEYYPNGYTNRNAEVTSELTISDKEQADFIEKGKKKFLEEARKLAKVHENAGVVDVRDFFEANKTAYIVMEFLDGKDLRTALKEKTFTTNEIFRIMRPVIDALEKVHAEGIIHCDISPDNIMLLKNGSVKLMDFGAARVVNLDDEKSRSVVLKAGYAPEEQYRPKGNLGPWSDIYALCATMYKCITGMTPDDALERSHKDAVQWPSEMGVEITEAQEAVLKKGMAVDAKDRFQNVTEMKAMLDQAKVKIHAVDFATDDDDEKTMYMGRGGQNTEAHHEEKDEEQPEEKQDLKQDQEDGSEEHADAAETGKKKVLPMAGIAVAAAVVIGGLAMFAGGKKANLDAAQDAESVVAEETGGELEAAEVGEFSFDEYIHVILGAGEEISVKGFNDAVQTLGERLEVFSGDMDYGLEVVGDKVDLYIPKSGLGDYDIWYMLRCYLTRATDLYAFNMADAGYNPEKFALKREDLAEVTVMNGSIAGVEPTAYEIDSDTYPYLKVVLTDACAEKHKEEIEAWGDQLSLAQDMSLDNYYYFNTFAEGDGKTFYLLNKDLEGPCFDLMYYNLTHEPLEKNFSFWIDLSYKATWDDVETAALVGENQCNVDEITGKTVTAYYSTSTMQSDFSTGELLDVETAFKERLDALGQPYAFGWDENEEYATVAVKTSLDHMGAPIMDSLGYRFGVTLRAGLAEESVYANLGSEISYEKNADGTYEVSLQVKDMDMISNLTGMLEEDGGGELILTVNGRPYLSAAVDEKETGDTVVFDQVYLPEKGAITDENLWVVKFVEQVLCGTELPYGFSCYSEDYFMFSDDPQKMEELIFGISYDYLGEEIAEKLNAELEEESTVYIDGTSVRVNYRLEVNETLPEEVLRLGKETYEKSGFADSPFKQLFIYFIEENNETKERVRVIFDKGFNICSTEEADRYIYVHGIFANGRLERYEEAFKNLVEADAFYQKMEDAYPWKDEYGLWQYD